jgi:hypothetical protein
MYSILHINTADKVKYDMLNQNLEIIDHVTGSAGNVSSSKGPNPTSGG